MSIRSSSGCSGSRARSPALGRGFKGLKGLQRIFRAHAAPGVILPASANDRAAARRLRRARLFLPRVGFEFFQDVATGFRGERSEGRSARQGRVSTGRRGSGFERSQDLIARFRATRRFRRRHARQYGRAERRGGQNGEPAPRKPRARGDGGAGGPAKARGDAARAYWHNKNALAYILKNGKMNRSSY